MFYAIISYTILGTIIAAVGIQPRGDKRMLNILKKILISGLLFVLLLSACSGNASEAAPSAVIGYLEALVAMDENGMINYSCAAWEEQARLEFKSFAAVKANLESPSCQVSGEGEGYTPVSCTGKIIANYGAEDLEIDLADRIYKVIEDGGEWRMCGYD